MAVFHHIKVLFISFALMQKKRTKEKIKDKQSAPRVCPANAQCIINLSSG